MEMKNIILFPFWMFSSPIFWMVPSPTKFIEKICILTNTYMPFSPSSNPKICCFKNFVTRAIQISSPQFLEKEKSHLTKALVANGYSISQINKAFHSTHNSQSKNPPSSSPPLAHISLPYIQGIIDHISRILAKKNIKTFFKPCKTLKQLFKTAKDKSDPMLGPRVYQIPCSYGKSYIGQTGRSFKARLKEHIADTNHNQSLSQLLLNTPSNLIITFSLTKPKIWPQSLLLLSYHSRS
jgi:hypothetical protein